jgi:hypothetical protein
VVLVSYFSWTISLFPKFLSVGLQVWHLQNCTGRLDWLRRSE